MRPGQPATCTPPTHLPCPTAPLQMCDNVVRHRLTLELRAGRAWRRCKAAAAAAATAPLRLGAELLKYLIIAFRLLVLDRIEAGHRAAQAREAARADVAAAPAAGDAAAGGGANAPGDGPNAAAQVGAEAAAPAGRELPASKKDD